MRVACVLAGLLLGCSRSEPAWISLDEGGAVRSSTASTPPRGGLDGSGAAEEPNAAGVWFELPVPRDLWHGGGRPGAWRLPLSAQDLFSTRNVPLATLVGEGVSYPLRRHESGEDPGPGTFSLGFRRALLQLAPGEEPGPDLRLRFFVERGALRDGCRRIVGHRFTGNGLSLWPGERLELSPSVAGPVHLRFATAVEPFPVGTAAARELVFRVTIDGRTALEHAATSTSASLVWHDLAVPGSGRRTIHIAFEVRGGPALTSILAPTLGPEDVGTYGERPSGDARPDLLLVLADTFRADNMESFGGSEGITPRLDELAGRSIRFSCARSTSSYTLPSHAALFTGSYPRRVGIHDGMSVLGREAPTLAGVLSRSGYRVGAITDGGYVSPAFGLDRGFPFFDAERETFASTRRRALAFLDADDGRPVFLFVHSYRVHAPYRVSAETRRELGERLGIEGDYQGLVERRRSPDGARTDEREEIDRAARSFYLGAVADLDRGMGELLDELARRGFFRNGVLLFTSDHGEAFGENGLTGHTREVFENQVRIPMLLHGSGISPGEEPRPVSLVDVTPTLASLAGLPADPAWDGRSLLENEGDRPIFLFQVHGLPERSTFGIVEGGRKVLGEGLAAREETPDASLLLGAFDLAADPEEAHDLLSSETWPRELLERYAARLEQLAGRRETAERAELDPATAADLRRLGYAGED